MESLGGAVQRLEELAPALRGKAATQTSEGLAQLIQSLRAVREGLDQRRPEQVRIAEVSDAINRLLETLPGLTGTYATKSRNELIRVLELLTRASQDLDPVKEPTGVFDPARPTTAGRLVALALIAQPMVSLQRLGRFYGSGVYAIYYRGDHPAYSRISKTETPIYVGKADPKSFESETPRDQGPQLSGRLIEHRRTIRKVEEHALAEGLPDPLRVADFECRRLVVATNAQLIAERYLINLFRPLWNDETKVCWGMSKHGDSAGTRSNDRSPWHVLHPGVGWALDVRLRDKKSVERIRADINSHLREVPPILHTQEIIEKFLEEFRQDPGLLDHDVTENEDEVAAPD